MKKIFRLFIFMNCLMMFLSPSLQAQNNKLSGTVSDSDGLPVPGVTVMIKGTTNGSITDVDGKYTLDVAADDQTLVFSFVGMTTKEVPVEGKTIIDVTMEQAVIGLEEVVAVGYGVQKKVNLTGAVSSIDGESIVRKASSDVLTAMQGELPGVAVLRSSGQPGAETSGIRIRGFSSVNSTSALVLIDGVEGDLTLVNPNDIESISILKDAAAAAIYGARAAAGVMLITTKSGSKDGEVKVNYNGYYGINVPGIMPERVTAWEEQDMINDSRIASKGSPEWNEEQSSWVANSNFNYRPNISKGRWDYFSATNWVDEGTKDYTTQQSHSVSISGGNRQTNYLLSGGYYTKNGLLKYGPDGYDRYNLRFKLNSEINEYVSVDAQINYTGAFTETNPYGVRSILERLYRIRARQPIYVPEEDINDTPYNGDLQVNPIDLMMNGGITKNRYESYMGKGSVTIQNIVKGLKLKVSASRQNGYYSSQQNRRHLIWYNMTGTGIRFQANNPNSLRKTKNSSFHDNIETLLTYEFSTGKHNFNVLAGTTYENYRKDEISGLAKNLNSNDFFSFNYYDASEPTNTDLSDKIETWAMNSYFGRFNYNYDNRYIFEANVRYDGSSRLAPGNRWEIFPSFSAAWRVTEEDWFDFEPISNLKLRGSWGQLGNGAVLSLYDYIATISSGTQITDAYYYQNELASKSKSWETIETSNIGLDLGFYNNRLSFTGDYYWKFNKNMLAPYQLPSLIGINVPYSNVGELKTWGWEFEVKWQDQINELSYQVALNVSDSQNELVKYEGKNIVTPGTVGLIEGYPLNTIWGYKTDGYWTSRDEYLAYKEANPGYKSFNDSKVAGGDVKYVAQGAPDHEISAGDGTPESPGDLVNLGTSNGRYLFGLNLSAQYKGFDFSAFFQGVGKRTFLVATSTIAPLFQTSTMPWSIHRDYWTEDNQDAYWPRMYDARGNDFNYKPSDKWVQNGAYIRLKNIQVGYTLPINKNIIEKARVYVSGTDVWEHSKVLSVFDPEVGNNASASYYPFFRTWSLGLNVTF
ncbi:TonB-linked outer membrane protein, SusC/RagA family [Draconibacterium orientale]|nr:TonB-dependent receptor [Draconibacterium orientale]SET04506.1 TonB-linked outer membrane protein, SusC/RagA family [Draconibacterium orientale]